MKALVKFCLSIAIFCFDCAALAWSRDAYFVLVVNLDVGKSQLAQRLIEDYFHGRFPEHVYACDVNNGGKFELSYLRMRPKNATNSLIKRALTGSQRDLHKLQQTLRNYQDNDLKDGFDFLLTYQVLSDGVEFFAVSAGVGQGVVQKKVAVDLNPANLQTQTVVAGAICKLSGMMPFVVPP